MDRINPVYIPRNHQVEEALTAASDGDLEPFRPLLDVLAQPFDERPGLKPDRPRRARRVPHVLRDVTNECQSCSQRPPSAWHDERTPG